MALVQRHPPVGKGEQIQFYSCHASCEYETNLNSPHLYHHTDLMWSIACYVKKVVC